MIRTSTDTTTILASDQNESPVGLFKSKDNIASTTNNNEKQPTTSSFFTMLSAKVGSANSTDDKKNDNINDLVEPIRPPPSFGVEQEEAVVDHVLQTQCTSDTKAKEFLRSMVTDLLREVDGLRMEISSSSSKASKKNEQSVSNGFFHFTKNRQAKLEEEEAKARRRIDEKETELQLSRAREVAVRDLCHALRGHYTIPLDQVLGRENNNYDGANSNNNSFEQYEDDAQEFADRWMDLLVQEKQQQEQYLEQQQPRRDSNGSDNYTVATADSSSVDSHEDEQPGYEQSSPKNENEGLSLFSSEQAAALTIRTLTRKIEILNDENQLLVDKICVLTDCVDDTTSELYAHKMKISALETQFKSINKTRHKVVRKMAANSSRSAGTAAANNNKP